MDRYRRYLPSVNKHLTKRKHIRSQVIHKRKLANIRSVVDSKTPKTANLSHMINNPNKQQMQEQKYIKIQHANTILLNKIGRIMAHGDELLDHRETTNKYAKSMNVQPRKEEFARINAQNIAMLQRLQETRAHVNVDELETTFLQNTLTYSKIVNKQPGAKTRTQSRENFRGKRASSVSPRKRRAHPFDVVAKPRAEQTQPTFFFRTTRTPYKSGQNAARIAIEEADSRDMTKLLNKGNATLRNPREKLAPVFSSPPESTHADEGRVEENGEKELLEQEAEANSAVESGTDVEEEADVQTEQLAVNMKDASLDEAKEEPRAKETITETKESNKDNVGVPNNNEDTSAKQDDAERRPVVDAREALIAKVVAEQHARWDEEEAAEKAKKKAINDAREALVAKLVAEQHARWDEEEAAEKAKRKAEYNDREALVAKLVAEQHARWDEEEAAESAAATVADDDATTHETADAKAKLAEEMAVDKEKTDGIS